MVLDCCCCWLYIHALRCYAQASPCIASIWFLTACGVHPAASAGPDTVLRLLVPGRRVGPILGRGGSIVKQIKDETGSRIRVVEPPPNCDERVVVISSREDPQAPSGDSNAQVGGAGCAWLRNTGCAL